MFSCRHLKMNELERVMNYEFGICEEVLAAKRVGGCTSCDFAIVLVDDGIAFFGREDDQLRVVPMLSVEFVFGGLKSVDALDMNLQSFCELYRDLVSMVEQYDPAWREL